MTASTFPTVNVEFTAREYRTIKLAILLGNNLLVTQDAQQAVAEAFDDCFIVLDPDNYDELNKKSQKYVDQVKSLSKCFEDLCEKLQDSVVEQVSPEFIESNEEDDND